MTTSTKDKRADDLKRPYDFSSPREYLDYLFHRVQSRHNEVWLSLGWHSSVYGLRTPASMDTQSYRRAALRLYKRDNGDYVVRYVNTDVVIVHPDGSITLDNGGWNTRSTHRVMNAILAAGHPAVVCSEKHTSTVYLKGWTGKAKLSINNSVTIPAIPA